MKRTLAIVLAVALMAWAAVASAEEPPFPLQGEWVSTYGLVQQPERGFVETRSTFTVKSQQGRAFDAVFDVKSADGGVAVKPVSGVVAVDNKKIFMTDKNGFMYGDIVDQDTLVVYWLKEAKVFKTLYLEFKRAR